MNRPQDQETIVALATPPGYGAIAVIRVDGPLAAQIGQKIAHRNRPFLPRHAHLTTVYERDVLLDQVVMTYFPTPHSYTGNDLIEISCHGNPYIVDRLLNLIMLFGARLAHPGEFTLRAFLNGKMNLLQAEAVAELVFANHQLAHQSSIDLLTGSIGHIFTSIREQLIEIISLLELDLDFSDQDLGTVSNTEIAERVRQLLKTIDTLIKSYALGRIIREGALVPIIGPVNSGKSSLLNALLMEDRAIVTPVPGTTRDYIEGTYHKDGLLFRLFDTAGLRQTDDAVEKIGIDRTNQLARKADQILLVLDLTEPAHLKIELSLPPKPVIVVLNKADIASSYDIQAFQERFSQYPHVVISAKRHQNLSALTDLMAREIKKMAPSSQQHYITMKRHYLALKKARTEVIRAHRLIKMGAPNELIATNLRWALEQIDTILGKTYNETILNNIFSHFCIGK